MRTGGKVEVEVIVDENGKVISARAVSGPTALRDVAVEAAQRARYAHETFRTAGKDFR
jgi:outer membrane biosynthesis protein TonB